MSYNIDSIDILKQDNFTISPERFSTLVQEHSDDLAEGFPTRYNDLCKAIGDGRFWWYGEGSGSGYDTLVNVVLSLFTGSADLLLCWEGGDSYSGLRVSNGKVTKHVIEMTLGKEAF